MTLGYNDSVNTAIFGLLALAISLIMVAKSSGQSGKKEHTSRET